MTDFTIIILSTYVPFAIVLWAFYFFCRSKKGEQWLDKHFE